MKCMSGKSNMIANLLNRAEYYEGIFDKTIIVSPTVKIDKSSQLYFREEEKDVYEIHGDVENVNEIIIQSIIERQTTGHPACASYSTTSVVHCREMHWWHTPSPATVTITSRFTSAARQLRHCPPCVVQWQQLCSFCPATYSTIERERYWRNGQNSAEGRTRWWRCGTVQFRNASTTSTSSWMM